MRKRRLGSRIFAHPGSGVPADLVGGGPRPGSLIRDTRARFSFPKVAGEGNNHPPGQYGIPTRQNRYGVIGASLGRLGTVHSPKAAKARSNNAISIFPRGDAELPRRVIVALPRDFWKGKSRSRVPDERARTGHPADKVGWDPAARVSEDPGPKA